MCKNTLLFILVLLIISSCNKEQYSLKWKVNENVPVIFDTQMKLIDSLSFISTENNIIRMMESIGGKIGDTIETPVNIAKMQSDILRNANLYKHFSILKKEKNGIHVDIIGKPRKEAFAYFDRRAGIPQDQSSYKGKVLNSGKLEMPYYFPKFIIMFELPLKPVSIGDTWSLNLELQAQNESSDLESDKPINLVTFVDVLKKGDELIAILKYVLKSPEKMAHSTFGSAIHFKGRGDFNITKGKWEKFEGFYVTESAGITVMKQTEKIKLTEISVEEFNSLAPLKPQTINNTVIAKEDSIKIKNALNALNTKITLLDSKAPAKETKKSECPVLYSVQVLAAKEPILPGSKEFKDFDYRVQERISDNSNEIYKFKYTVGNLCSIDKARKLRDDIRKSGFPRAFIIKTVKK